MERGNKVIAHHTDGSLTRGTALDFYPDQQVFHIAETNGDIHEVSMGDLKALFFVKDLNGDSGYHERKGFFTKHAQGKKIMVEFNDGEVIFGYTLSYTQRGLGFFMFPGDPACNNNKVFVIHSATKRIKVRMLPSNYPSRPYTH